MIKTIFELISEETQRQNKGIELIASENYPSVDVMKAQGSILTSKYCEGYPNKRYYGGCEVIDKIETIAIEEACKLFNCKYANVQPHSGSQANAAAYVALSKYLNLDRTMKILSLTLNEGGHLTHGSPVSFSSQQYEFSFYHLNDKGHLDFDIIEQAIIENKPDVILSGYSAYPYEIDFAKFKELADKYNCLFMVDMAHIAGLVACGEHISPLPYADIVTSTTHKTLRGPRGGIILTNNDELIKKINSAVFPYTQGGPLEHVIAGKAICFVEAQKPEFKKYIQQVKLNTKFFANQMSKFGCECSSTDNHLMLLNVKKSFGMTGLDAQQLLEMYGITTNKNMISNDDEKPNKTSGLRIGFAAITSRGCDEQMVADIAQVIYDILSKKNVYDYSATIKEITSKLQPIETLKY